MSIKRKIWVNAKLVAALWPFAAKEDYRYFLNGVLIEPHPKEGVVIVATNGHMMMVAHDENGYSNGRHIVTVSKPMLSLCKKKQTRTFDAIKNLQFVGETVLAWRTLYTETEDPETQNIVRKETLKRPSFSEKFKPGVAMAEESKGIDGKYPDWQRVVPQEFVESSKASASESEPEAGKQFYITFNAGYLRQFQEASNLLTDGPWGGLTICPCADKSATLIRFSNRDNVIGILMPQHYNIEGGLIPGWVRTDDDAHKQVANG